MRAHRGSAIPEPGVQYDRQAKIHRPYLRPDLFMRNCVSTKANAATTVQFASSIS
jgi:hypothetical protein